MADLAPILIAYDGSGCADAAIDKVAAEFAGRKVVILVVTEELDRVPFIGTSGVPIEPETMELLVNSARDSANTMAEKGAERAGCHGHHRGKQHDRGDHEAGSADPLGPGEAEGSRLQLAGDERCAEEYADEDGKNVLGDDEGIEAVRARGDRVRERAAGHMDGADDAAVGGVACVRALYVKFSSHNGERQGGGCGDQGDERAAVLSPGHACHRPPGKRMLASGGPCFCAKRCHC